MDNFVKNICNEAAFLLNQLKQRPIVEGTSLLFKVKQTDVETVWVHPLDETKTKPFYIGKIPSYLRKHFDKLKISTEYYQNVVRPRKGITNRSRDKRKGWVEKVATVVLS